MATTTATTDNDWIGRNDGFTPVPSTFINLFIIQKDTGTNVWRSSTRITMPSIPVAGAIISNVTIAFSTDTGGATGGSIQCQLLSTTPVPGTTTQATLGTGTTLDTQNGATAGFGVTTFNITSSNKTWGDVFCVLLKLTDETTTNVNYWYLSGNATYKAVVTITYSVVTNNGAGFFMMM